SLPRVQCAPRPSRITRWAEAGPWHVPRWPSLLPPSRAPASSFFSANPIDDPASNATRDAPPRNPRLLVTTAILPAARNDGGVYVRVCRKKEGRGSAAFRTSAAGKLCALGVHDLAEQLPALALETLQLDGLHRIVIGRAGADGDARQQARHAQLLMVGGLLHEILARQIVAAFLQRLLHEVADRVGIDVVHVLDVAVGIVLGHPLAPGLDLVIVRPLLVGGILEPGRRDDALDVLEARGLHGGDLARDVVQILHRLPADLGRLADRLRRELRNRDIEEDVGARVLELDDLRLDRGIAHLVGHVLDDAADFLAQPIAQAFVVVLAVVVV